jgi:type VI secretion system protein ImpL
MSRTPWRWQKLDGVDLGISADVLVEFQRAAAIRDAFFRGAGGSPALKFQLVPVSLDSAATQVVLQINGQDLSYAHGPQRAELVQWPAAGAVRDARLALTPAATQPSSLSTSGPWAFFRLLDAAQIEPTGDAARVHATWTVGGRKVSYDIEAGSVVNPLTLRELREFRCPSRL